MTDTLLDHPVLLIFGGLLGMFAVLAVVTYRAAVSQRARWDQMLQSLGFQPAPELASSIPDVGKPKRCSGIEVLRASRGGREYAFYYSWVWPRHSQKEEEKRGFAIFATRVPLTELPEFELGMRRAVSLAWMWDSGFPIVELPASPADFSSAYQLRAPDAGAIEKVFTPEVMRYLAKLARDGAQHFGRVGTALMGTFMSAPDCWLACRKGEWLQLHYNGGLPTMGTLGAHFEQAVALAEMFRSGAVPMGADAAFAAAIPSEPIG